MNTIKTGNVRLKRAYAPPESTDGIRILVDRLWPRGVKKDGCGRGSVAEGSLAQHRYSGFLVLRSRLV